MQPDSLNILLQNMDIYLLDQILKGRITSSMHILDAGCGSGRNSKYLLNQGFNLVGIDISSDKIKKLQHTFGSETFRVGTIEKMNYTDNSFQYIICNAVLHFADSTETFYKMFSELFRVLDRNGTLFIRMTSNIGIENSVTEIENGVFNIPDGSKRFLLTKKLLQSLEKDFNFTYVEPIKTVNVNNLRCMTTLILKKQ